MYCHPAMASVAVVGASGYVGGELLRLLASHPHAEPPVAVASTASGQTVGSRHRHLRSDERFRSLDEVNLGRFDLLFVALPPGELPEVEQLAPQSVIVDCSAGHRLERSDDWADFYDGPHLAQWTYGLPEIGNLREELTKTKRIAVPGCYASAITLSMYAGIAAGFVEPDVVAVAASGLSGAGRSNDIRHSAVQVIGSTSAYAVGGRHRHTPEIAQNLREANGGFEVNVSFTPMLTPTTRGILSTSTAPLSDDVDAGEIVQAYEAFAHTEPFIELLGEDEQPRTAAVCGSNMAQLQVAVDKRSNRLTVVAAIDNLVKGAAGAAVQSANIAMGWPEDAGLPRIAFAP